MKLFAVGIIAGFVVICIGFLENEYERWCACAAPMIENYCACTPFDWTLPAIGIAVATLSLVGLAWTARKATNHP